MSILRTAKAVLWAFLGVRKRSSYEEDLGKLSPFHIIAVALVAVAIFVGGLIVLVNWVVKN
jgi:hypothetical protein